MPNRFPLSLLRRGRRLQEILRRARLAGYDGGKSALYGLVKGVRPTKTKLVTRFEGLPGEFSQHDFGRVRIKYLDGSEETVRFFASRLKYSRWSEVDLVENEQTETLVRTLCSHFEGFGGVPLLAVFDRPKTVALKWRKDGTITDYNPVFAQAVFEMGVGVEVCWPYSPQQKGSVENLVGWVKGSFFKCRTFRDRHDLVDQLSQWKRVVNEARGMTFSSSITWAAYASAAATSSACSSGYASRIRSTVYPPATIPRMFDTMIRVPRMVGLPLQIRGSTTMRSSIPTNIGSALAGVTAETPATLAGVLNLAGRAHRRTSRTLESGLELEPVGEVVHPDRASVRTQRPLALSGMIFAGCLSSAFAMSSLTEFDPQAVELVRTAPWFVESQRTVYNVGSGLPPRLAPTVPFGTGALASSTSHRGLRRHCRVDDTPTTAACSPLPAATGARPGSDWRFAP